MAACQVPNPFSTIFEIFNYLAGKQFQTIAVKSCSMHTKSKQNPIVTLLGS